jgi:hypothetical protein
MQWVTEHGEPLFLPPAAAVAQWYAIHQTPVNNPAAAPVQCHVVHQNPEDPESYPPPNWPKEMPPASEVKKLEKVIKEALPRGVLGMSRLDFNRYNDMHSVRDHLGKEGCENVLTPLRRRTLARLAARKKRKAERQVKKDRSAQSKAS